jgi:hypothetical protein
VYFFVFLPYTRRCRAPECFSAYGASEGLYPAAEGDPAYPVKFFLFLCVLCVSKIPKVETENIERDATVFTTLCDLCGLCG